MFKQSYAAELLSIAEGDWKTARYLYAGLKDHAIRNENYFFQVQQVLEKLMKAVLVSRKLPVPLVHDLGILLAKIPNEIEPTNKLSACASVWLYEEGSLAWEETEAEEAYVLAEQALQWARSLIGKETQE